MELLCQLADNLEAEGLNLKISHLHKGVSVQAREVTNSSDRYSHCSSITGFTSRLTTLLLSVTSDNKQQLNHKDRLKDLSCRFTENWSFHPDLFLGKRTGLVGIFSGAHLEIISWDDSMVKTVSGMTKEAIMSNNHLQVTIKPINLENKANGNVRNTMAIAVYAPIEYSAEVKGACIRITHDKSANSLGLHGGKSHGARAISKTRRTRNVILANHNKKLSKISQLFLRVEALEWSRQVTTDERRYPLLLGWFTCSV